MEKKLLDNLIQTLGKFKDLKRTGWLMFNVTLPESDADHSFGVALLATMLAPEKLNRQKCIELALIHDLAEIYAGDITPHDNIPEEIKDNQERKGALRLADELSWPNLINLVDEYNSQKTLEARFIKLIDKLETLMSAKYYTDNNRSKDNFLEEFTEYAQKYASANNDDELIPIKKIIESF